MADAKRCDVCGEFYPENPAKRYSTGMIVERGVDSNPVYLAVEARQSTASGPRGEPVDLCVTCMDHALVDAARSGVLEQEPVSVLH